MAKRAIHFNTASLWKYNLTFKYIQYMETEPEIQIEQIYGNRDYILTEPVHKSS